MAVTTRVACVGNGVPWVRAGVGAVATQASTRTEYGQELLDMLEQLLEYEVLRYAFGPSMGRLPGAPKGEDAVRRHCQGGAVASAEPFAEGWLQDGKVSGRPVDVIMAPDGSLLVSDDKQ